MKKERRNDLHGLQDAFNAGLVVRRHLDQQWIIQRKIRKQCEIRTLNERKISTSSNYRVNNVCTIMLARLVRMIYDISSSIFR